MDADFVPLIFGHQSQPLRLPWRHMGIPSSPFRIINLSK
jgi:hypothetical protein